MVADIVVRQCVEGNAAALEAVEPPGSDIARRLLDHHVPAGHYPTWANAHDRMTRLNLPHPTVVITKPTPVAHA